MQTWLDEAVIPYEIVRSVWHQHSDNEHMFIDATKQGAVEQAIKAIVARENALLPRKKKATYQLVGRSRQGSGGSFCFSVTMDEDGCLIFHEAYVYGPQGDDEGREYHYYLTIPATHFQAALTMFAQQCKRDVPAGVARADERELLIEYPRRPVASGLGSSERLNAAITTLQRWLNQAEIPSQL